jgi:threonine/homoserine efflux transporter RhtA
MTGGDAATALLIFGVIFGGIELSLFVSTRSVISPAIVAILFGGVIFSVVPATLTNLALVAILLLLGGLGLLVAYRSGS